LRDRLVVSAPELLEGRFGKFRLLLSQTQILEALAQANELLASAVQILLHLWLALRQRTQPHGFFGERSELRMPLPHLCVRRRVVSRRDTVHLRTDARQTFLALREITVDLRLLLQP